MSGYSSVDTLMDHMGHVEKRRRLVVMQQKETEVKLAIATQEQRDVERERRAMQDREARLQTELDALAAGQRQVAVHLIAETDRVRRSDDEEPLLFAHAKERLAKLEAERAVWASKRADLDASANAWRNDPCTTVLREGIAAAESDVAAATRSCATLEQRMVELRLEIAWREQARAAAAAAAASRLCDDNSLGSLRTQQAVLRATDVVGPVDAQSEATAMQSLRDCLQQAQETWGQVKSGLDRQTAAVRREVDDLATRVEEMGAMLSDVQSSSWILANNTELLRRCVAEGRCRQCVTDAR